MHLKDLLETSETLRFLPSPNVHLWVFDCFCATRDLESLAMTTPMICMNAFFCIGFSKKWENSLEWQKANKICCFSALAYHSKWTRKIALCINSCQHVQIFKLMIQLVSAATINYIITKPLIQNTPSATS